MSTFLVDKAKHVILKKIEGEEEPTELFAPVVLENFSPTILGLGDIALPSTPRKAICAFFDLEGFTLFCRQVDAELVVPSFLSKFLEFIFTSIKDETITRQHEGWFDLFCDLPFYVKFMGDGLLVLWDTENMHESAITNVAVICTNICWNYKAKFRPRAVEEFVDTPTGLRCGIARGTIFSIGNGEDYVGPCINIAARLQKIHPKITIAVQRKGILVPPGYIVKKISIRGIGDNELIFIDGREYEKIAAEGPDALLRDPAQ